MFWRLRQDAGISQTDVEIVFINKNTTGWRETNKAQHVLVSVVFISGMEYTPLCFNAVFSFIHSFTAAHSLSETSHHRQFTGGKNIWSAADHLGRLLSPQPETDVLCHVCKIFEEQELNLWTLDRRKVALQMHKHHFRCKANHPIRNHI